MAVTEKGTAIIDWRVNTKPAEADLKKLAMLEEHLAKARQKHGKEYVDTLAKQAAGAMNVNKAMETVGLSAVKASDVTKTMAKEMTAVDKASAAFGKKMSELGKTLGNMAAGFGLGLALDAGRGLLDWLLSPPSPESMDRFIGQLIESEHFMAGLAKQAQEYRKHMQAVASARAWLETTLSREDALVSKYSQAAKDQQMIEDFQIIQRAYDGGRLTIDEMGRAISDLHGGYQKAIDSSDGFVRATERVGKSAEVAAEKVRRLNPQGRDWRSIYQKELTGALPTYTPDDKSLQFLTAGTGEMGFSGDFGGETDALTQQNLKLADSYYTVATAVAAASEAFIEGNFSMAKAGKAMFGVLAGAAREWALGQVKLEIAKGIGAWPHGGRHFAAAAAYALAAGVLGGAQSRLGGGSGGGGGGTGGYSGAPSVAIGSGGGGGGQRTIVVYASVDSSDSARVKTEQVRNQVGRALGQHGVRGA